MNPLIKYYYENERYLFNWALTFCRKNKMDAEDLVHDCLLKILISNKVKDKSFKAFWATVFKNHQVDNSRRAANKAIHIDFSLLKNLSSIQHHSFDSNVINEAVAKLPKKERKIIQLIIQGYSCKEVSEKIKLNYNTVKVYKMRGTKKLSYLKPLEFIKPHF